MGDGFIRWYRESGSNSIFSCQVVAFDRNGVTIAHPDTGVVAVVNVDGDDVAVDFERLAWLIGLRTPSVTVNWWISPDTNAVGTYSHEPMGCEVQTFWLDGVNASEVQTLKSAIMSTISQVSTPTRALVCDVRGLTDVDDWDSVALYEGAKIPGAVDSLLLGQGVADRVLSAAGLCGETGEFGFIEVIAT
ncbi:hypothetical protein [Streptomyces sp. RK62]|uniref:hypothetical protein n=1 Tax=Streptomyces sp. RK62 TaxID=2824893 RepID=UPI001B369CF5|nr:hypothetical protein [Streptomyces sp. RK62]MBQ0997396.1 hypothetical protein [Streptomyces sp. RK62]